MDFTNLRQRRQELLDHLEREGYTPAYVQQVRQNIGWILKREAGNRWESYLDVYWDRVRDSESESYKKNHRVSLGAIRNFDLDAELPDRGTKNPLFRRGAYHRLAPEFKELVDFYKTCARGRGLKDKTVEGGASSASSFLWAMQQRGARKLALIGEEDVLSFFTAVDGAPARSRGCRQGVAAVLKAGTAWKDAECAAVLAALPPRGAKRKNVQFLRPEEAETVRACLEDDGAGLSLRDRAIGKLLFFTGMRACDIAALRLSSIDWGADVIRVTQQKTGQPLEIPLRATVGNAIWDYLAAERPESPYDHLFLGSRYPHRPFKPGAVWNQSEKIYQAAGIRQHEGDRRGTHLFRHHLATSFLRGGVSWPVISQTMGHADPKSLQPYLHADITHLRRCALSIKAFPVGEGVFDR
jgi:integrase